MNHTNIRKIVAFMLLIGMGMALLLAQAEEHGRRTDAILAEIMANQQVESISRIDPDRVATELLEELGDAVMGLMIADEEQHAVMDRMMGGEESEQLTSTHRWLGYRYLQNGGNLSGMGWGPGMMGYGMMRGWADDQNGYRWNQGGWGPGMMGARGWNNRGWGYDHFGMMNWRNPWVWIPGILLLVLIVVGIVAITRRKGSGGKSADTPLEILRARYARGEISREEFSRIRDELK